MLRYIYRPDVDYQDTTSEEARQKVAFAVRYAERRITENQDQLARFSRLKVRHDTVVKSLEALRSRLDGQLKRVRSTVKDASDIRSFISKISAKSLDVEGIENQ